ncbi:hypothetical protein HO133_009404 [Letharia lupina]|uniref:Lysyl-tRNA synthetase n=1 Tax=Letharia lupina TaxID=560253 RepID=A0A8H6CN75_9LECA|nr:uncharacterized protein HO133_009404 [Letharia lupina]KAF6226538.1 hypothetical protein HO133_009404 [Letharia lupina]
MRTSLRCLGPALRPYARPTARAAHLRFYSTEQAQLAPRIRTSSGGDRVKWQHEEQYPRIKKQDTVLDYHTFKERYKDLGPGESKPDDEVVVRGRIWSFRVTGSKLAFLDLFQNNRSLQLNSHRLQCVLDYTHIAHSIIKAADFKDFLNQLHRGDIYSVKGIPHRTPRNDLSVLATDIPQLLSPCTQSLPAFLLDKETKMRNRHVDLLLNPQLADIVQLRSEITKFLRQWLLDEGHTEVQTPILADAAGGAVARPFHTSATEFQDRQIALRIAPELWLKRLIVGGFERVFEIGPSFRNEGIDLSHNPEFTTCEFYRSYADIEELINTTERMFLGLSRVVTSVVHSNCRALTPPKIDFSPPLARLDFIPAIEAATGKQLPELTWPDAQAQLLLLFNECDIPLPSLPTLPRLLDRLSAKYLEPQCFGPTWIINHPECLSPLSKSFMHPDNQQRVSARAELFVRNTELVNCYEEENSPIEQRRKLENQLQYHEEDPKAGIDENYLQALEWGLPPTGGWGCGIDRLCMLFSGTNRIADVLSFGTLRNVVALGRDSKRP